MRPLLIGCAALALAACGETAPPIAAPAVASAPAPEPAGVPVLRGRVMDNANLLSPVAKARITAMSEQLERRTSDQLVVATLPDLHGRPIEQVGLALGRSWRVGQAGKDNGVLLIVAPQERKVRIEVGCGLERILTNERAAQVIDREITPSFAAGEFDGGAEKGAQAIAATLTAAAATPRVGGCRR